MKYILIIVLISLSCGKIKHEVKGVPTTYKIDAPHDFKLGPDFKEAMELCDARYGKKTAESEACFQDYRDYTKLKISIDLDAIKDFCGTSYEVDTEIRSCIKDLTELFTKLVGNVG